MRTREELNKEWKKLDDLKTKNQKAMLVTAICMVVGPVSLLFIGTAVGWYIFVPSMFVAFLGNIKFAIDSEKIKELQREWQMSGYGLKKYPNI